jgi:hypothetical protein
MNNPLGANWKTSSSGYIETLCLIVAAVCILPPEIWARREVWLPSVGLIAAKTVKDSLTKDRNVTGGTTQQDAKGEVATLQVATPMPPDPALPDIPAGSPKVVKVKLTKKVKPKIKVPPRIT